MISYTNYTLKKLETLFQEMAYTVRYEKGTFQSGYCIVEDRRIAVINKFFDTEARINCFLDILTQISVDDQNFSPSTIQFYQKVKKFLEKQREVSLFDESGTSEN